MDKNENLARVSKDLMFKEPFYGIFLIMLNKVWTKDIQTAGVGKNGINFQLYINEDFWSSLSNIHKMGLLKHELLHIAFSHVTEFEHLTNKDIRNIAMDIEINQYIDSTWLPEGACTIDSVMKEFEIKLHKKQGTKYYYNELMKIKDKIPQSFIITISESHATWEEFNNLDEATKKLIEKQMEYIIKEISDQVEKSRGTIPSELTDLIERIKNQEPPKFDWRGYLRRFAGSSINIYTKKLRRKPNKRFEDNPGLKIKKRKHILIAVDTSGSVDNNELIEFFNEIDHIHKTGSDVTVIQCDAAIQCIEPYKPKLDIKIKGRGGTSFDPVIEYYNKNKEKYSCLVYLTDGEAPAPEKARGKMLWVMSSKSNINPNLIGPQIKLN